MATKISEVFTPFFSEGLDNENNLTFTCTLEGVNTVFLF